MKNIICLIMLSYLFVGCSVVGPGQRGLRLSLGTVADKPLESGAYLWVPFLYGTKKIDITLQKSDVKTSAASKDMQEITTEVAVNWSINPDTVVTMYKNIGDESAVYYRIIQPAVSEIMKSAMAKKTAEEVLINRLDLKKDIDEGLKTRLAQYGVTLNDVSIVNLTFSHEFTQAIERKQVAEQAAKQAEYTAQKATADARATVNEAKGKAESRIIEAKAEAEAQRMLQLTVTDKIIQLKAIEKWDGTVPQVMGNGGQMLFNIPTKQTKGAANE